MDLFSTVMKRLYIHMLPLNYAILDYHSIEIFCFRYNESAGVFFFTSTVHCFGRFFGRSFGLLDLRTIGISDYRAFGLLGLRTIGPSDYRAFGLLCIRTIGPTPDLQLSAISAYHN